MRSRHAQVGGERFTVGVAFTPRHWLVGIGLFFYGGVILEVQVGPFSLWLEVGR